jgi:hypothetical protein
VNCSEFLTGVERRLEEQIERGKSVGKKLDVSGLNFKVDPAKWSAGQIFEHMMLANANYLPVMKGAIDGAPRSRVGDSIQHTWFGKFIMKGAGPDGNAPAPKSLHPRGNSFDTTIVDKWTTQTQAFLDLARRSHGVDLCSMKIKNPFVPLFKVNLADCFEILAEHTERHIRQIESLAEKAENAKQRTSA